MTATIALHYETDLPSIDELVSTHLPLVGHLVRDLLGRVPAHIRRDDLMSAGMMALVLSARSFDAARGVPFGRFAAIRIRGALTDELRAADWASRGVRSRARDVAAARNELAVGLGRSPKRAEIAETMGFSVQDLDDVDRDAQRATVLSLQGLATEGGAELLPTANDGPESLLLKREQVGYLLDAIAELPDRLRLVVEQYFFAQRKMADIAAELGVTESRISQLRSEALAMLRAGLSGQDAEATAPRADESRRHTAAREAYRTAVAAHSTLSGRLHATTLLGECRQRTSTLSGQGTRRLDMLAEEALLSS